MSIQSCLRRVAIVGAGPAGLYTAKKILALFPKVNIKIFERENSPFGLLRYGVAPDHVKIKKSMKNLQTTVLDNERVSLHCNTEIGYDKPISISNLRSDNQAVVIANGASVVDSSSIAFTKHKNVLTGLQVARWYNGYMDPEHGEIDFDREVKNIVVLGLGDVSMDVARIMLKENMEYDSDVNLDQMPVEIRNNLSLTHSLFIGN